jgi:hypothetical protein
LEEEEDEELPLLEPEEEPPLLEDDEPELFEPELLLF